MCESELVDKGQKGLHICKERSAGDLLRDERRAVGTEEESRVRKENAPSDFGRNGSKTCSFKNICDKSCRIG